MGQQRSGWVSGRVDALGVGNGGQQKRGRGLSAVRRKQGPLQDVTVYGCSRQVGGCVRSIGAVCVALRSRVSASVCGPHPLPCSTRPLALHTHTLAPAQPVQHAQRCTRPSALGTERPGPHPTPAPSRSDHSNPTRAAHSLLPCTAPSGPHPIPSSTHLLALCAPACHAPVPQGPCAGPLC